MATVSVYGFDTGLIQEDFKFLIDPQITSESSTKFVISDVGTFQSTITFLGNFTLSSGNITSGTITEVQVTNGTYLWTEISGLDIAVTNTGFGFSFNAGAIFPPGSTYYAQAAGSGLEGIGDDTYYANYQATITPGLGTNAIYANASGVQINLKGSTTSDTFIAGSNGTLTVIDSSSAGTAADSITGSAKLFFEGDDTFVQDNNGSLTLSATAAQAVSEAGADPSFLFAISDSTSNVSANLNALQNLYAAGQIASLTLTNGGELAVPASEYSADSGVLQDIQGSFTILETGVSVKAAMSPLPANVNQVMVLDSAANVFASLDALQALESANTVINIMLTDTNRPTMTITAAQDAADAKLLTALSLTGTSPFVSSFGLDVTAGSTGGTITGFNRIATTVTFSGDASAYTITSNGDGSGLTVTGAGATYHLSDVQALQFADSEVLVTASPGQAGAAVTTGNLAELYGAVFGRVPDVSGLAYYQGYMTQNPATPLQQYAQWFLSSAEYTGNPAHNYAQTVAGDQQFISDSYQNLLHRTPTADEVAFYENNVIAPALKGLQAGTAAYQAADLAAHALTLVYFSASSEFLGDVQVTPANPASAQHWLILA